MKTIILLLLIFTTTSFSSENLIINPSFEDINSFNVPKDFTSVPVNKIPFPGVNNWYMLEGSTDYHGKVNNYLLGRVSRRGEDFTGTPSYHGDGHMGFRSKWDYMEVIEGNLEEIDFTKVESFNFSARVYNRSANRSTTLEVYLRNSSTNDSLLVVDIDINPNFAGWFRVESSFENSIDFDFDRISIGMKGNPTWTSTFQYHLIDSLILTANELPPPNEAFFTFSTIDTTIKIIEDIKIPVYLTFDSLIINDDTQLDTQTIALEDLEFNTEINRFLFNVTDWENIDLINSSENKLFFKKDELEISLNESQELFMLTGNILLSDIPNTAIKIRPLLNEIMDNSNNTLYHFNYKDGSIDVSKECFQDLRSVAYANKLDIDVPDIVNSNKLDIKITLPISSNATINIQDISGRSYEMLSSNFSKGSNELTLDISNINSSSGFFNIILESNGQIASENFYLVK